MLDWTHIHLMINHVPVIGLAVPIAFLLIDRVRNNRKLEWLSLQMFVVFAVLAIPVYLTGSPASHKMRELPGISLEIIHRHSNAADLPSGRWRDWVQSHCGLCTSSGVRQLLLLGSRLACSP